MVLLLGCFCCCCWSLSLNVTININDRFGRFVYTQNNWLWAPLQDILICLSVYYHQSTMTVECPIDLTIRTFFFVLISNPAVDNRCVCMCVCASNFILFNVFNSLIAICLFIWKFNGLMIFFLLYDDHSIWSILIAYRIDSIWQSFFIAIAFKFCFLCIFFPGVIRFIHSRQTKTIPGIYDYNMIIYR